MKKKIFTDFAFYMSTEKQNLPNCVLKQTALAAKQHKVMRVQNWTSTTQMGLAGLLFAAEFFVTCFWSSFL